VSPPSSEAAGAANAPASAAVQPIPASATAPAGAPVASAVRKVSRWNFGRHLRLRIGAEQLQLDVYEGRKAARRVAGIVHDCGAPTELLQAVAAIGPALDALLVQWKSLGGRSLRGLECQVVIDDSWMLYDVVRADLRGLSPGAADSLIGASLADVAGVDATELISRWQAQGQSPFTVACGLPSGTLAALQEALAGQGLRLDAVEGEFVAEINRNREALDPRCAVVAVVRDAGAQLGILVDGILTAMSFEYGVGNPKELELRSRGLLRSAGVNTQEAIRFYAITAAGAAAPEPWVGLAAA